MCGWMPSFRSVRERRHFARYVTHERPTRREAVWAGGHARVSYRRCWFRSQPREAAGGLAVIFNGPFEPPASYEIGFTDLACRRRWHSEADAATGRSCREIAIDGRPDGGNSQISDSACREAGSLSTSKGKIERSSTESGGSPGYCTGLRLDNWEMSA